MKYTICISAHGSYHFSSFILLFKWQIFISFLHVSFSLHHSQLLTLLSLPHIVWQERQARQDYIKPTLLHTTSSFSFNCDTISTKTKNRFVNIFTTHFLQLVFIVVSLSANFKRSHNIWHLSSLTLVFCCLPWDATQIRTSVVSALLCVAVLLWYCSHGVFVIKL